MRNRILNYLASGIKPAQVATIVGVSPGYLSQLLKDDAFKEELELLVLQKPADAEETDLDNKYISLEHQILRGIEEAIPGSELPALARILDSVTKRQDMRFQRKHPVQNPFGNGVNVQVVQISLPAHSIPHDPVVELNSQGEILAINNKPLAPMSSDSVKNLFAKMQERKEQQYAELPRAIPADL